MREGALPGWADTRFVARLGAQRMAPDPGSAGGSPNLTAIAPAATGGGGWMGPPVNFRLRLRASLRVARGPALFARDTPHLVASYRASALSLPDSHTRRIRFGATFFI
jgi:hypothetical protein